ncbi:lytic transglycosylase domain-containing protein [Chloroflexota bacterium]
MSNYSKLVTESEVPSNGGSDIPGILLPPLAVILVGFLITLVTGGIVIDHDVGASSPSNGFLDLQVNMVDGSSSSEGTGPKTEIGLATLFTPEVLYWREMILGWSSQFDLDPNLVATIMQIESCGDPDAVSNAGAMGLFQVMPFHFELDENPFDPTTNALRGLNYLERSLEESEGDTSLAMAGYNGGIGIIWLSADNWVDETRRYVYWGSGIYQEAIQGKGTSLRLEEWLSRGGVSLCSQAAVKLASSP